MPITPQEDKRGDSLKSFKYSTSFTANKNRNNYARDNSTTISNCIEIIQMVKHYQAYQLQTRGAMNAPWKFAALQKLRGYGRAMLIVYWNDLK